MGGDEDIEADVVPEDGERCGVIRWLIRKFNARRRRIDLEILWPSIRDKAPSIDRAREAFYLHAVNDEAWKELGFIEMGRIIGELK